MTSPGKMLKGKAAACSPGIVIGRVQKVNGGEFPIPEIRIGAERISAEIARFEQALTDAVSDFDHERRHLMDLESQEPLHILDAQQLMLLDAELSRKVIHCIRDEGINAEWAVHRQIQDIANVFDGINDAYLRARKSDIQHIGQRILSHLSGAGHEALQASGDEPLVVAGTDFTPIGVLRLWRQGVAAFIAEKGGPSAHSIIIARGIGITALMGAEDALQLINDGDRIVIDGEQGVWLSNPTPDVENEYRVLARGVENVERDLQAFAGHASRSRDGHALRLMANLELEEELPQALELGTEGVGLYRTEFLLSTSDQMPDEEAQYQHYAKVMRTMRGLPVTFRLMDIGGEKPLLFEQFTGHRVIAANPALGLRGVRLLLHAGSTLLHDQLRALLRASNKGDLQIHVPMVSQVEEMQEVRRLLVEAAAELGIEKIPPLGTMIEVPAAVIIADALAEISDFFSVGTNDLIQYTLAADRADEEVTYLYSAAHPALEPMLRMSVQAAHKAGIPIAMCGELAADLKWTERLMNMGFDSLSMSLHHILPTRKHLASLNYHPES